MSRPSDAVTPALHRALAALLGLPDAAALPLDYAVLVEHEPQAALERAWGACPSPRALHDALAAFVPYSETLALRVAWRDAVDEFGRAGETRAERDARCAADIRAAVPCPVLPTTTESEVRDGQ